MFNPFFIYIYSFLIVFIVYQFNWSYKFPKLSIGILAFFIFSGVVCLLLGFFIKKNNLLKFYQIAYEKKIYTITSIIFIGYIIEFIYFKNIPVMSLFLGVQGTLYKNFGIPVFHVGLVTFNAFFAVYIFHVLLCNKKKKILVLFILLLIPSILIVNRGMFLMTTVSCLFIYLYKLRTIKVKVIVYIFLVSLIFLYLFGIFGNMRVNNSYKRIQNPFDSTVIFTVGGATESFMENPIIPKPYFWSYIYIASPLANFQETVDKTDTNNQSLKDLPNFINNELIPDFINKRVNEIFNWSSPKFLQISQELNVGTMYAAAYTQLGWLGVLLIFTYLIVFSIIYLLIIVNLNSAFYLTGAAILSTVFVFNTFSNMITFSGLSFQLIYPILFGVINIFGKRV